MSDDEVTEAVKAITERTGKRMIDYLRTTDVLLREILTDLKLPNRDRPH